jgi:hypothetical protein
MEIDDSLYAIGARHIRRSLSAWAWTVGIAALVVGALWYWLSPKTFDQCMLAEMRGQDRYLITNAEKVCAARFPAPPAKASVDFSDLIPKRASETADLPPGFVIDSSGTQ